MSEKGPTLPYSTKPHWMAGFPAIMIFAVAWGILEVGAAVGFSGQHKSLLSGIVLTIISFAVYEAVKTAIWIQRTRFTLTEHELTWQTGIIKRRLPASIAYRDITSVNVVVSPIGELLDYGSLRVDTVDGRRTPVFPIANIKLVARILESQRQRSRKLHRSNLND